MSTAQVSDATEADGKARRMTLSRVLEELLAKREHSSSSVSLARNAKGETQIEVVVRTSEAGAITTVEQAEAAARLVYDRLRAQYPSASGHTGPHADDTKAGK